MTEKKTTLSPSSLRTTCLLGLLAGAAPFAASAHDFSATGNGPERHDTLMIAQIPAPDITPLPPIYDPPGERPSLADRVSDALLASRVRSAFTVHPELNESDISVDITDGVVTLTGSAISDSTRARAIDVASDVEGVKEVNGEGIKVE